MARLPIATENNTLTDYKQGTDTEVWVSPITLTNLAPSLPVNAVSIHNLNLAGTTPLLELGLNTTTPLPLIERLPHGFRLRTADGQVFVVDASREAIDSATSTRFIPAGVTSIPILLPATTTLTKGVVDANRTTADYNRYLPFYSVAEGGFKGDGDEVSYRNIGAGPYEVARKTKIKSSFTTSGYYTPGDTMLTLIRRLVSSTTESIAVLYIPPDDEGVSFVADVKSDDRSFKTDDGYMVKLDYSVTTQPRFTNLVPS